MFEKKEKRLLYFLLGLVLLAGLTPLGVLLWDIWYNQFDVYRVAQFAAWTGAAAGPFLVAYATFYLVEATGQLADLTEREQQRSQAEIQPRRLEYRNHGEEDKFSLTVINGGWKPTAIDEIRTHNEDGTGESSTPELQAVDGDAPNRMVGVGERVQFRGTITRPPKVEPGDPVYLEVRPVLGDTPGPIKFAYPEPGQGIAINICRDGGTTGVPFLLSD